MTTKELSERISKGVSSFFQEHGFVFRKKDDEFVRKIDQGEQILRLFYYKKNNHLTVKPEIIIKIYEIESIYKSVAEIKYRPYLTLGNNFLEIRDYDGDEINYKKKPTKEWLIENDEDVEHLIKIIPEYLEEDILPYFDNNSSVARVDELLNKYPQKMCVHNYIYPLRANIAIIAAKLNENPQYNELVEIYEKELLDAEENYKKEFYKIVDVLKSI